MFRHSREDSISDGAGTYNQPRRESNFFFRGLPKNNSDNCLTIQVPEMAEDSDVVKERRRAQSSPTRHPTQRRRYSQGAVLDVQSFSIFRQDTLSSPSSCDEEYLRHSLDNLRHISSSDSNPFASTMHLMDHGSSSSSEARRKTSRTAHERLHKLGNNLNPLDDICESPLVKTPNEPVLWSLSPSAGSSTLQQQSTSGVLFALDSVSASLQANKG